jgi:hypothetical protein
LALWGEAQAAWRESSIMSKRREFAMLFEQEGMRSSLDDRPYQHASTETGPERYEANKTGDS